MINPDDLRAYFGVPKNTPIIDEFPQSYMERAEYLTHEGKVVNIPAALFSMTARSAGGCLGFDCAIAKQAEDQGHRLLVGSRTAYTLWKLSGKVVIAKVAHTGHSLVKQNDIEKRLAKVATVYFYPLTPGRTAKGLAKGRGTRGSRGPNKSKVEGYTRNMDTSLKQWMDTAA